ncbi:MAG: 16S rRNA (guanine527-N7)-methyltransferase [Rhodospirillaceae bacterium]|nr:MAG: 16S rRNA (guanine527-N7)-methyltransferase [Rhodospirillaceae bacterium]
MTPATFQAAAGVSRETMERLQCYAVLLCRWQTRINLVGAATLSDLWRRHLWDSAQLWPLLPVKIRGLVDLGSGAGFPGLVLAILGVLDVHLIEANARKSAFLREAARLTETSVIIHTARAETLTPWPADIVTARAMAPLDRLLALAAPFLTRPQAKALFLKGRTVEEELTAARKQWSMTVTQISSQSDPSGIILCVKKVHRV